MFFLVVKFSIYLNRHVSVMCVRFHENISNVFNLQSGHEYMVQMTVFNIQRAITAKVGKPELWFGGTDRWTLKFRTISNNSSLLFVVGHKKEKIWAYLKATSKISCSLKHIFAEIFINYRSTINVFYGTVRRWKKKFNSWLVDQKCTKFRKAKVCIL